MITYRRYTTTSELLTIEKKIFKKILAKLTTKEIVTIIKEYFYLEEKIMECYSEKNQEKLKLIVEKTVIDPIADLEWIDACRAKILEIANIIYDESIGYDKGLGMNLQVVLQNIQQQEKKEEEEEKKPKKKRNIIVRLYSGYPRIMWGCTFAFGTVLAITFCTLKGWI